MSIFAQILNSIYFNHVKHMIKYFGLQFNFFLESFQFKSNF